MKIKRELDSKELELKALALRLLNETEEEKKNTRKVYKSLLKDINEDIKNESQDFRICFYENDVDIKYKIVKDGCLLPTYSNYLTTVCHPQLMFDLDLESIMDYREIELCNWSNIE